MTGTEAEMLAMFEEAPIAQVKLDFDKALDRAAANAADFEAFSAISLSMDEARASNDLSMLREMAMTLGAMACMHDHLQQLSTETTEKFADSLFGSQDNHGHDHDDKKDKHDTKNCPNCKAGKACAYRH